MGPEQSPSNRHQQGCARFLAPDFQSALGLTPRTNDKAERFIQTLLAEWAYSMAFQTSAERNHWWRRYLTIYNGRRFIWLWPAAPRFSSSDS